MGQPAGDEELVRRSQRGDAAAFEEIIRRRARLVLAHLRGRGLALPDAEDVTQETFLRAWRAIGQLRDARQLNSWLLTLATRAAATAARRAGRGKRRGGIFGAELMTDNAANAAAVDSSPPAAAAGDEQRKRLRAALDELPEQYRLPLQLRYLAGCEGDEIRRQLGLTDGALRGLLHRGLQQLRAKLLARENDHARHT